MENIENKTAIIVNRKEILLNTLKYYNFNINDSDYCNTLLSHFENLTNKESRYFINIKGPNQIFPKIALVINILNQAKDAIDKLNAINKSDKKIAYYEKAKNENLDDLIKHSTKRLNAKGTDEITFESAQNEIKLKRLISKLKKRHPVRKI